VAGGRSAPRLPAPREGAQPRHQGAAVPQGISPHAPMDFRADRASS
jgi:hypothetical protein